MTHCKECGQALIATSAEWLCCPAGHGRLVPNNETGAANRRRAGEESKDWKRKLADVTEALRRPPP